MTPRQSLRETPARAGARRRSGASRGAWRGRPSRRARALVADLAAELEELVEGDAELVDVAAEVLPEQLGREDVDAGRHGRVRREDVAGRRDLAGLGEGEVLLLHEAPDLLERDEGGVALVDVPDRRLQAELVEGAQSRRSRARSPAGGASRSRRRRGGAVISRSGASFSGRFESSRSSGTRPTFATRMSRCTVRPARSTVTIGGLPSGVSAIASGSSSGSSDRVRLVLHAVVVDDLAEVALPVEEPDARQRHAEVARGLEVVAGEHAEAARRRSAGPRSGRTPPRSRRSARRGPRAPGPPGGEARPGPPRSAAGPSPAARPGRSDPPRRARAARPGPPGRA